LTELISVDTQTGADLEPPGPESGLTAAGQGLTAKPLSPGRLAWRRFRRHKLAMLSAVALVIMTIVVFFPSLLTDWDPLERSEAAQFEGPSADHWAGTDQLRHDMLSRILHGGQISLKVKVGLAVALVSAVVGSIVGAVAGYYGRWVDNLLMRATDLFLAIPLLVALIILTRLPARHPTMESLMGETGSVRSIITILSVFFWMPMARIVRGVVLSLKEKEFIESAKALGASDLRVMSRHLLPNCLGPIIVNVTLSVAAAILTESALSFLGYGVQSATTPTWGNLLANTKSQLRLHGHVVWGPGLAIVITVLAVNYLGDGLRDALDPRQRKNKA
jgi:peptide/nickel transport system permease protein